MLPFGDIKTEVYPGFTNGIFLSTIAEYRLEMGKRGGFNTGFGYRIEIFENDIIHYVSFNIEFDW